MLTKGVPYFQAEIKPIVLDTDNADTRRGAEICYPIFCNFTKIFMKKNYLWSLCAMMCLCVCANAQDDLYADSIRHYELAEINVSANQVSSTTPMVYSTLNESQIKEQNYGKDLPYLLESLPSVVAMSDAGNGVGYTEIRVRGYDGSRINVTANGVPMNDAESHKVYWVNTPDLMSSVGNIQVVRVLALLQMVQVLLAEP